MSATAAPEEPGQDRQQRVGGAVQWAAAHTGRGGLWVSGPSSPSAVRAGRCATGAAGVVLAGGGRFPGRRSQTAAEGGTCHPNQSEKYDERGEQKSNG